MYAGVLISGIVLVLVIGGVAYGYYLVLLWFGLGAAVALVGVWLLGFGGRVVAYFVGEMVVTVVVEVM